MEIPAGVADLARAESQIYRRAECAVFRKTHELWGEFSNMAGGFPVEVNGKRIATSEALYQACRFPHLPEVQRAIIAEASPMSAKMKAKTHRKNSRPDFNELNVQIMWWALRVKLACNQKEFSRMLRASRARMIVEDCHKDTFWGAKSDEDDSILEGQNVLGHLLVKLRDWMSEHQFADWGQVEPLEIPNFTLFGEPIRAVSVT